MVPVQMGSKLSFSTGRIIACVLSFVFSPLLFLIDFIANLYYWYNEDRYVDTRNKAVLISGCDSGFGELAAKLFASRGVRVFAGCLTSEGVDALNRHDSNIRAFLFNVTSEEDTKACLETVSVACRENGFEFWGLIANAGIANPPCPADWFKYEDYFKVIDVNLLGHIRSVVTFLPLIKRSNGRIVITISIAGHLGVGGLGPYCAAKFGALGFADSLRCDVKGKGVRVATVSPEFYPTHIINTQGQVEAAWQKLSDELKAEYPLDEVVKNRNEIQSKIDADMGKNDPIEVAEAYYHATFAAVPRMAYFMGKKARFYEFVKKWPDFLVDYVLLRGITPADKK